jgi:hypothetical protein
VMEYNFSLYFGFAVAEYEKTLRSDNTPFDTFMLGNDSALSASQQNGLQLFLTKGRCINCHSGPEFTNASLSNVSAFQVLERMIMGDDQVAVYDNGFYNTGVRPTLEDIGVGGTAPSGLPLSNSRLFERCLQNALAANSTLTIPQANQQCNVPRILARPIEAATILSKAAALLPDGDASRVAAEDLIAQAQALLATLPPNATEASCKLAKNPKLPGPTTTFIDPNTLSRSRFSWMGHWISWRRWCPLRMAYQRFSQRRGAYSRIKSVPALHPTCLVRRCSPTRGWR